MKTTHHDRHAAAAKLACDLVAARGRISLNADCHQVGWLVIRNHLQPVIIEAHGHVGWGEARQYRRSERLHLPAANVARVARVPANARMHQCETHRPKPPAPSATPPFAVQAPSRSCSSGPDGAHRSDNRGW